MQTLIVTKKDPKGKETLEKVTVLRSWQDGSNVQIYLHTNGVYGYKDGAPVKTKDHLMIIGDLRQRNMALHWWNTTGNKISAEYYAAEDARLAALAGDFQEVGQAQKTELDFVLYSRRPTGSKSSKDWSEPFAWIGIFAIRPDWWGQAEHISFKDFEYKRIAAEPNNDGKPNITAQEI